jgi:tRNA 5-methylaminomethyl-2-thiouridine biosynthesis bifunctional protein
VKKLPDPNIIWREDGTPESAQFSDIYFAPADGLAETRHVFIDGIGGPEAWQGRDTYTIFETGFGTGLNFLATWQAWQGSKPTDGYLHYVSVEAYPLSGPDLQRALAPIEELAPFAGQLHRLRAM